MSCRGYKSGQCGCFLYEIEHSNYYSIKFQFHCVMKSTGYTIVCAHIEHLGLLEKELELYQLYKGSLDKSISPSKDVYCPKCKRKFCTPDQWSDIVYIFNNLSIEAFVKYLRKLSEFNKG